MVLVVVGASVVGVVVVVVLAAVDDVLVVTVVGADVLELDDAVVPVVEVDVLVDDAVVPVVEVDVLDVAVLVVVVHTRSPHPSGSQTGMVSVTRTVPSTRFATSSVRAPKQSNGMVNAIIVGVTASG